MLNTPSMRRTFARKEITPSEPPRVVGIGIDIGMTYSGAAVSFVSPGGAERLESVLIAGEDNAEKFPSKVFIERGGEVSVGASAEDKEMERALGAPYQLFKRDLGIDTSNEKQPDVSSPIALTSHLIRKVSEGVAAFLRERDLDEAQNIHYAFTFPGMWDAKQRRAFNMAITAAGIAEGSYSLLEEPMATALDAASDRQTAQVLKNPGNILICDLGGGTFDLAIVAPAANGAVVMKAASSGDSLLGMSNIDKYLGLLVYSKFKPPVTQRIQSVLAKSIIRGPELERAWKEVLLDSAEKARLLCATEALKINICNTWRRYPSDMPLIFFNQTISIFRTEIEAMFHSFETCIRHAVEAELARLSGEGRLNRDTISRIILGGGGSNLPGIERTLQQVIDVPVIRSSSRTAASMVQRGAARFARDPELIRERRCGHSYGVKTFHVLKPGDVATRETRTVVRGETSQIYQSAFKRYFEKDEPIPLNPREYTFTPLYDDQSGVGFEILEGESDDPARNRVVDSVELSLPPGAPHTYEVTCRFRLEPDGLIHVVAKDIKDPTNRSNEITFTVAPQETE